MITFHAVKFRNFLSSGDAFSTIKLGATDLTMIIGRNGAGKSTMIDAICFALYGKPFRKINKPQLVNSVNRKNCEVQIAFSIGNSKYAVRRGIKPNVFEIFKDKELIPEDPSVGDYQKQLDAILNISFKTFCQVNIIGKASYVPFMSLKAEHRREVVEDLLDSHVYGVMLTLAKADQTELNRKIRDLDADRRVVEAKVEAQQKLIERQSADNSSQILEKKDEISKYQIDLDKFQQAYDKGAVIQKNSLTSWKEANNPQIHDDVIDVKSKISSISNEITRATALWNKIEHMEHCPTCTQSVEQSHKDFISKNTDDQVQQLKIKKLSEEAILADLTAKQQVIQDLRSKYDDVTDKLSSVSNKISLYTSSIQHAQIALDKLQLPNPNATQDLEDLEDLKNNAIITETKYNKACDQLVVVKNCIALLGDDGIKAKLVSKYIPIINKYINEHLEKMDLFVQFELDEQFNETIKSRYRDAFVYESFSEGEKARIDLAILLTWRKIAKLRNSTITNILIMDETLDGSMDTSGSDEFLGLLKAAVDTQNAFLISHNQSVIDGFDNIIVAEKIGNFTEYSVQGRDD